MLARILSGDLPRSRALTLILVLVLVGLALAPFLFPGQQQLNAAAKICVFIVLVASYDLLLGYTGIASFGHTVFYGMGGYGIGLMLHGFGATWVSVMAGLGVALTASIVLALVIAMLSLRVRATFFSMITLAVAVAFEIFASQLSWLTGGEDGRSFKVPELLRPGFRLVDFEVLGVAITGRVVTYYLVFAVSLALFLVLLRVVNSPFGRVLQAIRENEFRAEAIGYRTVVYRSIANCLAAGAATMAGALMALWLRYVSPDTMLGFHIMIDILLMVVIGGMGTIYGAAVGVTLLILAQNYLQELMKQASESTGWVFLQQLLHPDRWLLWLGILFVLSVYFFPAGIVGRLRKT